MIDQAGIHEQKAQLIGCPNLVLLKLRPPHFSRSYGVLISFTTAGEVTTMKYEMMVTYVKTLVDEQVRIFSLERLSPVYINDLAPESTVDQLAYETGKVFYPLLVQVGFDGAFIGIFNHDEIKKRWVETKEKVMEYFTGEETEKYLAQTELMINDGFALDICFRNDWFINTFFAPIYKSYGEAREVKNVRRFALSPNATPEHFDVIENIDPFLNHYNAIEIHHKGKIDRTELNLFSDGEDGEGIPVEAIYEADIVLQKETKSIDAIIANWSWSDGQQKSITLRVFNMFDEPIDADGINDNLGNNLMFLDKTESRNGSGFGYFFKSIFKKTNTTS